MILSTNEAWKAKNSHRRRPYGSEAHEHELVGRASTSWKTKKKQEGKIYFSSFLNSFFFLFCKRSLDALLTWNLESWVWVWHSSSFFFAFWALPGHTTELEQEILFHKRFMLITWDVVLNNLTEFMLELRFIFSLFSFARIYSTFHCHLIFISSSSPTSIVSQWKKIVFRKMLVSHTRQRRRRRRK